MIACIADELEKYLCLSCGYDKHLVCQCSPMLQCLGYLTTTVRGVKFQEGLTKALLLEECRR